MANRLKGEIEISLGGKKRILRPTFEGLMETEDKAGAGIGAIIRAFSKQEWSFRHVAAVIYGGLLHLEDPMLSFESVGAVILKDGIKAFTLPAISLLSKSLAPERDAAKEGGEDKKGESDPE